MSPEAIGALQSVFIEAVKIVGPATVAAYAAYKAATIQVVIKLRELDNHNQFRARELLFSHLRQKLTHIDQQVEKLNRELGELLGFAASRQEAPDFGKSDEFISLMSAAIESIARLAPLEVSALLNDMRTSSLTTSAEYGELASRQNALRSLEAAPSYANLRQNVLTLLELYSLMGTCTRLLLEGEMHRVLGPYVSPPSTLG